MILPPLFFWNSSYTYFRTLNIVLHIVESLFTFSAFFLNVFETIHNFFWCIFKFTDPLSELQTSVKAIQWIFISNILFTSRISIFYFISVLSSPSSILSLWQSFPLSPWTYLWWILQSACLLSTFSESSQLLFLLTFFVCFWVTFSRLFGQLVIFIMYCTLWKLWFSLSSFIKNVNFCVRRQLNYLLLLLKLWNS